MTRKDKVIRKLIRAAKKAIKELDFAMPCTPAGDAWNALHEAVRFAKKTQ
jgi:hypothetical protein